MKNWWKIKMIFFVIAAVIAMGAVVMWLWNWLVPQLFNGPTISFLQSMGLMLLSRILFRGFFGHKGGFMHERKWRHLNEGWEKMSPEQREKMRDLWKKRCGGWDCGDEKPKSMQDQNPPTNP